MRGSNRGQKNRCCVASRVEISQRAIAGSSSSKIYLRERREMGGAANRQEKDERTIPDFSENFFGLDSPVAAIGELAPTCL